MPATEKELSDINQSKILYNPPPRVTEIKTKVNKWDLIKLKSCCTAAKETISKVKRHPSEWENIIANEQLTEDLFPKYRSGSYNSTPEKQPNQNIRKRPKQTFLQRKYTDG